MVYVWMCIDYMVSFVDVLDSLQAGYREALDLHVRENLHSFVAYCRKKMVSF